METITLLETTIRLSSISMEGNTVRVMFPLVKTDKNEAGANKFLSSLWSNCLDGVIPGSIEVLLPGSKARLAGSEDHSMVNMLSIAAGSGERVTIEIELRVPSNIREEDDTTQIMTSMQRVCHWRDVRLRDIPETEDVHEVEIKLERLESNGRSVMRRLHRVVSIDREGFREVNSPLRPRVLIDGVDFSAVYDQPSDTYRPEPPQEVFGERWDFI